MTTPRRRTTSQRRGKTLDSLSLPTLLALRVGSDEARRGELDAIYEAVRAEFLASDWADLPGGEMAFAERRYQERMAR